MEYGSIIVEVMEEIRDGKYTRNGFIRSFMRAFISRFIKEPYILTFYLKYFGNLFKEGNECDL
jgi:hypothetical protein